MAVAIGVAVAVIGKARRVPIGRYIFQQRRVRARRGLQKEAATAVFALVCGDKVLFTNVAQTRRCLGGPILLPHNIEATKSWTTANQAIDEWRFS